MKSEFYVVTGCAGFIGYHYCKKKLKNKNIKIIGIDNLNSYYDSKIKYRRLSELKEYKKNFFFKKIDLKNKNSLILNLKGKKISKIINSAGQAGVKHSVKNPHDYVNDNISSFINLLEFFKDFKNKPNIIFASSSSVYGDNFNKKSNLNFKPNSVYAISKLTMEMLTKVYCQLYKFKICGLRFFTVYGSYGRPDMSYYIFAKKIINNEVVKVYNKGLNQRSFTHINDLLNSINKVEKFLNLQKKGFNDNFNIGNPKSYNVKYLLNIIEKNLQKRSKVLFLPLENWDIAKTKSNIHREKKLLKLNFSVNLKDGIKEFTDWFKRYE